MIHSKARQTNTVCLPKFNGELSMIPFDLTTLVGLPTEFVDTVTAMLSGITAKGIGFFTIHGASLLQGKSLRRPAPHTDGNYNLEAHRFAGQSGGGNGWKVGENGAPVGTKDHAEGYLLETGGLILVSDYPACMGFIGDYEGSPRVGGDCRHINLNNPMLMEAGAVWYGNNQFVHESRAVNRDIHRVFARITLPSDHVYK